MSETSMVLKIDKPHFTVKLFKTMLTIDVKGSTKNKIEEALENKPVLKQTLGAILSVFAPLHIHLSDISHVRTTKSGKIKLVLPRHRDVVLQLEPEEAKELAHNLNRLIPTEKRNEILRLVREAQYRKAAEEKLEVGRGAATFPIQQSTERMVTEIDEDIDETAEREEQKKED